MQENTLKTFLIRIDTEISKNLEIANYEIDRLSDIVARLISKNFRFDSIGVVSEFDKLVERCIEYDIAKARVSDEIVIPKASVKWGEYSNISWQLNFSTCDITVTFNGTVYQKKHLNIAEASDEIVDTLKTTSAKRLAYIEVYDKLKQQYPTIDTDSYKEFLDAMNECEEKYTAMKNNVNVTYVLPYLDENHLSMDRCQWNLNYTSKKIDVFEAVSSAADV